MPTQFHPTHDRPTQHDKLTHGARPHAQGSRFAILHGDGPKPALTVYNMKDVKAAVKGVQPAGTLPGRTANSIHWSPQGKNLVLAGLKVCVS